MYKYITAQAYQNNYIESTIIAKRIGDVLIRLRWVEHRGVNGQGHGDEHMQLLSWRSWDMMTQEYGLCSVIVSTEELWWVSVRHNDIRECLALHTQRSWTVRESIEDICIFEQDEFRKSLTVDRVGGKMGGFDEVVGSASAKGKCGKTRGRVVPNARGTTKYEGDERNTKTTRDDGDELGPN
ncbi:hypothetical protein BJ165DRAFT_1400687 [Panaeolus papilionaceus]|nr:hypothetical protein BJ165DRAFT_1400687 [Panaeolus papilionaceus]